MSPFGESGAYNANKGYLVPHPPDDTVSRLRFSPPQAGDTYLVASSWNGSVRCWKVNPSNNTAAAISMVEAGSPVLDCAWAADGRAVYCAGADKLVTRWDLSSNDKLVVAAHDLPIRHLADVTEVNMLATASWDKSLRYWDVRAPPTGTPVGTVTLADRAYAMDVSGPLLVVGLADRKLAVYDVRKPTTPFVEKYTQLRYQTRCVATWPDRMGYLVGSVDGKVSIDYVQEPQPGANYSFYCHRDKSAGKAYSINAIRFHRQSSCFATAGSDGKFAFWDKDRKDRAGTRRFERLNGPVCDIDFSADGRTYAYAVGYDWNQGATGHTSSPDSTYIVLDRFQDGELDGRNNGHESNRGGRGRGARRRGGRR